MLAVKGIGPKKVRQLWMELQIESVGQLLYACNENRLIELKGFGAKTQESVKKAIEFNLSASGKYHFASVEGLSEKTLETLRKLNPNKLIEITGDVRRKNQIVERVEFLVEEGVNEVTNEISEIPFVYHSTTKSNFYSALLKTSSSQEHLDFIKFQTLNKSDFDSEENVYKELGQIYFPPELREGLFEKEFITKQSPTLITYQDLKGVLHNHCTYSDGMNTLKEMAEYAKHLGLEYLGMCDHSQSAFYANGLKTERVIDQQLEIDELNTKLSPFKIFKGIESDILNDGNLDYPEEILKTFDFIVASVHSNLKMTEEKAMTRIIKAIENPYTRILGHPTSRLLLAREGYPLDHKKIIDACAANNVVMELNAHPYRLDIDWKYIPYCLEKGVMISINPDAHHKEGYLDMRYGVSVARKGILTADMCLNSKSLVDFEKWIGSK